MIVDPDIRICLVPAGLKFADPAANPYRSARGQGGSSRADITKLDGPAKWADYHLHVILDIYSRCADRGSSMTSKPSRCCSPTWASPSPTSARTSNDNPYSEAQFKTSGCARAGRTGDRMVQPPTPGSCPAGLGPRWSW
jgi:hypothetical protein